MSDDTNDPALAATAHPGPPAPEGELEVRFVRLSPSSAVVPPDCACCGAVASRTLREERSMDAAVVLVPYCGECHAHAVRGTTERLAVGIASALLALTLAAGLPLLGYPRGLFTSWAVVALGTFLPLVAWSRAASRRHAGHAAAARAAWFRRDGALVCARPAWGECFAVASGTTATAGHAREPKLPFSTILVGVSAVLAAPFIHRYEFPLVRVVNVSGETLTISVDGRAVARVEATSAESPSAGVTVRVAAGRRAIAATSSDGHTVDAGEVVVRPGLAHLYAPASLGTCFWTEVTGYGNSRDAGTEKVALSGEARFWTLPDDVDYWFSAPPADSGSRATGGLVRAVRQSRCDEAPAEVR